jgi:transposase
MAVVSDESTETICERKLTADTTLLVKTVKGYQEKGEVVCGYESGCLGYSIQRAFAEAGISCLVLSANKVAKKREDKIKTDKRDARLIARMLRNGEAKGIGIPTKEDEAARDLLRMREDVKDELKRMKQRLLKFLLRYGYECTESWSVWTVRWWKWLDGITFGQPTGHR